MKINRKLIAVVLAGLMTLSASPLLAQESDTATALPQVYQVGKISYTTGGFGLGETDAMKATSKDYNLIVSNAVKAGNYTTADSLVILQNKKELLTVTNIGPLFYAKLPPGSYLVQATSGNEKSDRNITITGKNQQRIHFIWSE